LVGIGASASAPVGPVPSGVTLFGSPTPGADPSLSSGTAAGGSSAAAGSTAAAGSSSAATPAPTSGASHVAATTFFALFAAVLGLVMTY